MAIWIEIEMILALFSISPSDKRLQLTDKRLRNSSEILGMVLWNPNNGKSHPIYYYDIEQYVWQTKYCIKVIIRLEYSGINNTNRIRNLYYIIGGCPEFISAILVRAKCVQNAVATINNVTQLFGFTKILNFFKKVLVWSKFSWDTNFQVQQNLLTIWISAAICNIMRSVVRSSSN